MKLDGLDKDHNSIPSSGGDPTKELLERAKAALSKAPAEDLAEIQHLIQELQKATRRGKQSRVDELAELLFFIE